MKLGERGAMVIFSVEVNFGLTSAGSAKAVLLRGRESNSSVDATSCDQFSPLFVGCSWQEFTRKPADFLHSHADEKKKKTPRKNVACILLLSNIDD